MSRVFIPQVPSRYDTKAGWVPTVNIDPAKKYGELRIMLPPEASRLGIDALVRLLQDAMIDFNDDDYVLALGDPAIIGITCAIADRASSPLRMLRWDRNASEYLPIVITLDENEEAAR
jgi:hypothetical protein